MEVDQESGEPPTKRGEIPGHVLGWYCGNLEEKSPELLANSATLPVELVTKENVTKGIYAVVVNAKTFGIKVTLKFC